MTDTSKATARPWRVKAEEYDYSCIVDRDGDYVSPFTPQHAAIIVQSVNSFTPMLDALNQIAMPYDGWDEIQLRRRVSSDEHFRAVLKARAAIKLAEENP